MDSGIIAKVESDFSTDGLSFLDSKKSGEFELKQAIDIKRPLAGLDGKAAYEGQAAIERVETVDSIDYSEDGLYTSEAEQKFSIITDFLLMPEELVIVDSSQGEFVFDLLSSHTGSNIERIDINLNAFYEDNPDAEPWMSGFYGLEGNTDNGIIYGQNVADDGLFGQMVEDSKQNQLGLEGYRYKDLEMKFRLTESGYVQVYQPSNFESEDFIRFLVSELKPYME